MTFYANIAGPSTLDDYTSTETYSIRDGSFSDAQKWAAQHANSRPYRLGIVTESHGVGVSWLIAAH